MILKGIELMIVGMGAVFIFLTLLVIMMRLSYKGLKLFNRIDPEQEEPHVTTLERAMVKNDDIAVAIAAVKAFMKR